MSDLMIVVLMFISFIVFLFMGQSLSFVLGGLSILFGIFFWGNTDVVIMFARIINKTAVGTAFVCVPMFILMGAILERSGVAERLFDAVQVMMGQYRGGLAIATIAICALMGAATGIIGATVTIMGMMALPAMLKAGYDKKLASGTVMSAGCLGTLIPPSVILVVYASLSQISIAKLFAAGMTTGLFLAFLYAVYVIIAVRINPSLAPVDVRVEGEKVDIKKVLFSFLPPMVLILLTLGSIIFGVATPNEASALGALGTFFIAALYGKLNWKMVREACHATILTTSMTMWIILSAGMFTSVFIGLGGDRVVTSLVTFLGGGNQWPTFIVIALIIFLMGMLIDGNGIMMIGVPLFTPIIYAFGFDPIWFALIFATLLQMSFLSPPFAYAIFFLRAVAPSDITSRDMYRAVIPFIVVQVVAVILLSVFPEIITWLPNRLYPS